MLNATKQEKALVDAIDYKVDPSRIRGFKLNPKDEILPWIIEEYGLEEILRWAKDKRKAVDQYIPRKTVLTSLDSECWKWLYYLSY